MEQGVGEDVEDECSYEDQDGVVEIYAKRETDECVGERKHVTRIMNYE